MECNAERWSSGGVRCSDQITVLGSLAVGSSWTPVAKIHYIDRLFL